MSVGLPSDEVAEDYKSSLEDLVDNSRLVINNLTVIAKENIEHASAISRVLESHIKNTGPNRKLPALYLLDSIVKNVGTPYTLFLSRNLFSTFMNAYSLVSPMIRVKLDEMLQTWKAPNPGSLETKPVFPIDVTKPIEEAITKARQVVLEQHQRQSARAQQDSVARSRHLPQANLQYSQTPAAFQPSGQYGLPLHHHQGRTQRSAIDSIPQSLQNYATNQPLATDNAILEQSATAAKFLQQPAPPVDLPMLHKDIGELVLASQKESILKPHEPSVQGRLSALLSLQNLLQVQYHSPEQLRQVRDQILQLKSVSPSSSATPSTSSGLYGTSEVRNGPEAVSPALQDSYSMPYQMISPSSVDVKAVMSSRNLANIIASAQKNADPLRITSSQPSRSEHTQNSSTNGTSELLASLKKAGLINQSASEAFHPSARGGTPGFGLAPTNRTPQLPKTQLSSAALKIPRLDLVSFLYGSRPRQCTTCGRRFFASEEGQEKRRRHYDWHFRTNQRVNEASKRAQNRSWYVDEWDWIKSREEPEVDPQEDSLPTRDIASNGNQVLRPSKQWISVPAEQTLVNQYCPICQEKFVASYNEDASDWVWMDALQVGSRVYHASCHSQVKKYSSRENTPARTETPDSVLGKRKAIG